jgi:hypothetical protein
MLPTSGSSVFKNKRRTPIAKILNQSCENIAKFGGISFINTQARSKKEEEKRRRTWVMPGNCFETISLAS